MAAAGEPCFMPPEQDADVLWRSGMEEGDLCAWSSYPGEPTSFDSGLCDRPAAGVTRERVYRGAFALAMRAFTPPTGESGCRQFRFPEAELDEPLYYSFWLYLPHRYEVGYWALLAQFKSRTDDRNDPIWSLQIKNTERGEMALALAFKCRCRGPGAGQIRRHVSGYNLRTFRQQVAVLRPRTWTRIEILRAPSTAYDGRIALWQDGRRLFDFRNVRTSYPRSRDTFSLAAYGQGVRADDGDPWFSVLFDEVAISRRRLAGDRP